MLFKEKVVGRSRHVNKSETNDSSYFFSCIKWPLLCYRYFFVFPISLEKKDNKNKFAFKWATPYMIFINIPILILQVLTSGIYCYDSIYIGLSYPAISLTVNNTCGLITSLLMLKLGKDFKLLYQRVVSIERKLPPVRKNIAVVKNIRTLVIVGCVGIFIQFALNTMYIYHLAVNCTPQDGNTKSHRYFYIKFIAIFRHVDFSYFLSIILQIVRFQSAILPTLNNVLMIACSAYLENRFENLNDIISDGQKGFNRLLYIDWRKIHEHYIQLTKLVKLIDRKINPIVFISFFLDIYNLCIQCYYVVSKQSYYYFMKHSDCVEAQHGDLQTKFYKPYAAAFMFCKMVTVSVMCARLYTASRTPLDSLHTAPHAAYNCDALRFMEQVYHSKIALSGFEFFYITKEMILTVLGILVTYELVLIQFK